MIYHYQIGFMLGMKFGGTVYRKKENRHYQSMYKILTITYLSPTHNIKSNYSIKSTITKNGWKLFKIMIIHTGEAYL